MKIRPYLNYNGNCMEAIELYKEAFNTETNVLSLFSSMPKNPDFTIPDEYMDNVLQCELKIGDDYIRMSDCGPFNELNSSDTEKVALCFEASVLEIQHAFDVLSKEGEVGIPLMKTFFSELHGVVYDKFGIMWTLVAQ